MVFAQLPRGFSALLLLNRRKGYNALLSLKPRRLFISFARTKETKQRKFAGCRSRAKIFTLFLKKKNSLRSNSFFFFTEKSKNFLTLFHGGRKLMMNMVNNKTKQKRNNHTPTSEALIDCAMLPRSFTTLCFALDDKKERSKKRKHHIPTSEAMLRKSGKVRPHFLAVKRRCFSERKKQKAV